MQPFRRLVPILFTLLVSSPFVHGQVPASALTAEALAGKVLNLTIEGGEAPFVTTGSYTITLSAAGNVYSQPAAGAIVATAGSWSHQPGTPLADAVLTLGNYFSDGAPATLSLLDSGFFELNHAGWFSHQYGHFTISPNSGTLPGTPPSITTQPANQSVDPGTPATFSVSVTETPGLVYQWRKNGVDIPGATASTLTIAAAAAADQASYTVVVATSSGAVVSSAATLAIIPKAPVITTEPLSLSAYTGGVATFSVTATGFPEPTYQWQYYGTNIPGATSATFQRNPVNNSQGGNYTCVVTNSQGSDTSEIAVLTVVNPPGSPDSFRSGAAHNGGITSLLVLPNGQILVAGGFNLVDFVTRRGIYLLNTDGTIDTSFNPNLPANPAITRVVAAPDGKFYIIGNFLSVDTTNPQRYIARLNANGSLDTTFAGLATSSFLINDLAVQSDGKVVIVGAFTTVNGVNRSKLARLNTDGLLDTTFNASGKTFSDDINTVTIAPNGRIYVGGKFLTAQGVSRPYLAALTTSGDVDTTVDFGSGFDAQIKTLLFQPDGKLLVGGEHTAYNGHASKCLTRIYQDGTWDSSFVSTPLTATTTAGVYSLALQANGKIVVGGAFAKVNNVTRQSITRVLPDGAVDPLFEVGVGTAVTNPFVYATAIQADGSILIGGNFTQVAGNSRDKFARLSGDSPSPAAPNIVTQPAPKSARAGEPVTLTVLANGSPLSYQWRKNGVDLPGETFPSLSFKSVTAADANLYSVRVSNTYGTVTSTAVALTVDSTLVPGILDPSVVSPAAILTSVNAVLPLANGKFLVGGTTSAPLLSSLAQVNADGTLDTTFTTKANGTLYALAKQADGKILIAGLVDSVGGTSRSYVIRLNTNGTVDQTFQYSGGNVILSLAVQPDGKILAAGYASLTRLETDGQADATFPTTGQPNGAINTIIVQASGKILLAGSFSTIRSNSRAGFARLNANGTLDTSFPTSFGFSPIGVLAAQSTGKLLLSTNSSGKVYRLTADGVLDDTFVSPTDNSGYISRMLVLPDDRILAARIFTGTADGGPATRFRRLDANGTLDSAFISEPGANGAVNALALTANGRILAGGEFTVLNSKTRPGGLGALDLENPLLPAFTQQPLGRSALAGSSTTFTALVTGSATYQWRRNGVDLAGQTSASLTIDPVSPSITGSYTVTATNSEGTVTSNVAVLGIAHPPVIISQPADIITPPNTSVTFSVTADSVTQPFTYQWRKNGEPLTGFVGKSIVLGNVTTADVGDYDVMVSNADGSATSTAAKLTLGPAVNPFTTFILANGLDPLTTGTGDADPDHDGLSNIFEYIAGGNPLAGEGRAVPLTKVTPRGKLVPLFTYEFDRRKDFTAAGVVIETSASLGSWLEAVDGVDGVSIVATSLNATTEHVTVGFPVSAAHRFIHVIVR